MSSDNDKQETSRSEVPDNQETESPVSRRRFLGLAGATALGAAAASLPVPNALAKSITSERAERDRILSASYSSPMFKQALKELSSQGFTFDLAKMNVERKHEQAGFYMVTLRSSQSSNPRSGAEILTRFDLESQSAGQVQYLNGTSEEAVLAVRSIILTPDGQRQEREEKLLRGSYSGPAQDSPECTPYYYKECCCWSFVGCSDTGCCWYSGCQTGICVQYYEVGSCHDCTRHIDCSTTCGSWYSEGRYRDICQRCCE